MGFVENNPWVMANVKRVMEATRRGRTAAGPRGSGFVTAVKPNLCTKIYRTNKEAITNNQIFETNKKSFWSVIE